ncbi:MAG: efflux RND transporter periplasmic adaptor subunit [Desulfuromonas sp.]|nr:efflux RND transporter periplasmic adaptor subunit [Desulfuromonas sp.]
MNLSGKGKSLLIVAGLITALGGGYWAGTASHDHGANEAGKPSAGTEKTKWTCGMHPFIIQDEPGLCPICGMQLTPLKPGTGGGAQASAERKVKFWKSSMDPNYIRNEPGKDSMGMDLVPVYEDGGGSSDGIAVDPVTQQSMGVRTANVEVRDLHRSLRSVGLVTFDEARQYAVNSKIEGWIERLHVNQSGQPVRKGQPLLEIYSPDLVAAQQEYLLALESSKRQAASPFPEIADGGRRLLEAARSRLRYWDISEAQIEQLEQSRQVRKTLTLYSPYGGIVTMKKALQGMRVMAGEELLQIADLSQVWVNAEIYEQDLPWVKVGQSARVELPYATGKTLTGTVDYIYPYLVGETRTVKARIVIANPGLELKPDMYANVQIATEAVKGVLAVPADAVLRSGQGAVVFVAKGDGKFDPRPVETGASGDDGYVQIRSGVNAGDKVVTSAQFMLDSESKLREAIQKMTEPQMPSAPATPPAAGTTAPADKKKLDDLFK